MEGRRFDWLLYKDIYQSIQFRGNELNQEARLKCGKFGKNAYEFSKHLFQNLSTEYKSLLA